MSDIINSNKAYRCFGNGKPFYEQYHDQEWGIPSHDERYLFEMLILEGAHAGLSWEIILKKRQGYKSLFHNFDVIKVSLMTDEKLEELLLNPEIVRNRLKVFSARKNALVFIKIQEEFGSFDNYIWGFTDHKTIKNNWKDPSLMPGSTPLSDQISKDLKKRGMNFVGSTIIYSYLQAVGIINDHAQNCICYTK